MGKMVEVYKIILTLMLGPFFSTSLLVQLQFEILMRWIKYIVTYLGCGQEKKPLAFAVVLMAAGGIIHSNEQDDNQN